MKARRGVIALAIALGLAAALRKRSAIRARGRRSVVEVQFDTEGWGAFV